MRLAILSDIHGNSVALDACLADLQTQGGADTIVVAGDLCMDGPRPKKIIDRIIEIEALSVRGNTDRYLCQAKDELVGLEQEQMLWTRAALGEKRLRWLSELPSELRFGDPENQLLVVHANPTNDDEHLWPDASDELLERLLGNEQARVIAFGHVHLPYVRLWRGRLLVNVASAGLPKDGDPRASYALLTLRTGGWQVKHRRVPFDTKRVAKQLIDCGIPGADDLIATFRRHRYKKIAGIVP